MSLKSLPIEVRGNLRHPYYVKPDMNPEERAVESQRWSLITYGVDRKDIHISKNRIYIKHKLVGVVKGSRLVRQSEETTEPSAIHQEQSADENEDSQILVPPLQTSSTIHFRTPLID